jgi:hypothetical protein
VKCIREVSVQITARIMPSLRDLTKPSVPWNSVLGECCYGCIDKSWRKMIVLALLGTSPCKKIILCSVFQLVTNGARDIILWACFPTSYWAQTDPPSHASNFVMIIPWICSRIDMFSTIVYLGIGDHFPSDKNAHGNTVALHLLSIYIGCQHVNGFRNLGLGCR